MCAYKKICTYNKTLPIFEILQYMYVKRLSKTKTKTENNLESYQN